MVKYKEPVNVHHSTNCNDFFYVINIDTYLLDLSVLLRY